MNCPKCACDKIVKSGIIKVKQRYKCKGCGYSYTVELKPAGKSKLMRKQALHLCLEELGVSSTGRFFRR
jgi:transposase-like protein